MPWPQSWRFCRAWPPTAPAPTRSPDQGHPGDSLRRQHARPTGTRPQTATTRRGSPCRRSGRPVARPCTAENVEAPAISVILEFPGKQHVEAFYHPEEYTPPKEFRHSFADAGALILDV
ncbi:DUF1330 domain-containing protein [Actinomadura namibiensis]|uniref:DUF1330 domain-containing protein n=1 Tax=Actinomadura kijaniata TaxID=46161 RepID=UPI0028A9F621|nr:DUF1330 domain-containing protein [Actinomadura namibiensis]